MEARLEAIEKRLTLLETPLSSETLHRCVQCGESYIDSRNPDGICEFHTRPVGDSWTGKPGIYLCCNTKSRGCVRKRHRNEHHVDYPYQAYKEWFYETLKEAEEIWVDLSHHDLESDSSNDTIDLQIGRLNGSETIFFHAGDKLRVFNGLDSIKSCNGLILEDKHGRSGYARIVHEGNLVFVASVLASSDKEPEIVRLCLVGGPPSDDFGGIQVKSVDNVSGNPSSLAKAINFPPLPSNKTEGPTLQSKDPPQIKTYSPESSSSVAPTIKLSIQGSLEVTSSWSASSDGTFNQYVSGMVMILNPSQSPILIESLTAEYLNASSSSEWIKSVETPEDNYGIKIGAAESIKKKVSCAIKVKGKPGGDNQSRSLLHPSLPSPLCVRFVVTLADGSSVSIKAEHFNPKREYPTKESLESQHQIRILHFAFCDDLEQAERHYVYVCEDEKGRIVVRNSVESTMVHALDSLMLDRLGYRAGLAGESERLIDSMEGKTNEGNTRFSCFALIAENTVYGLHFRLKTLTGSSDTYFGIRNRPLSDALTLGHPGPFKPTQLINVKWQTSTASSSSDWIGIFKRFAPKNSNRQIGDYVNLPDGTTNGDLAIRLPIAPGSYEIRLLSGGECRAKSTLFTIEK